jgi:hypothetical protein
MLRHFLTSEQMIDEDRGRDAGYPAPPAQIRTSPIKILWGRRGMSPVEGPINTSVASIGAFENTLRWSPPDAQAEAT